MAKIHFFFYNLATLGLRSPIMMLASLQGESKIIHYRSDWGPSSIGKGINILKQSKFLPLSSVYTNM